MQYPLIMEPGDYAYWKKYTGDTDSKFIRAFNPRGAEKIQKRLSHHYIPDRTIEVCEIRHVAGADAAYDQDTIYAAVVVMRFPGLEIVVKKMYDT